jgi:hypothetical protein
VQTLAGLGVRQAEIAGLLRCDAKTLRKYYRHELDTGATRANLAVAQSLYDNAVRHNNVRAQIWWTRARMGWKSVANVNVGGTDRPVAIDLSWAPALRQPLAGIQPAADHQHREASAGEPEALTIEWEAEAPETC